jgi:hypothetical protein
MCSHGITLNASVKNFKAAGNRSLFFWDVTLSHIPDTKKYLNCNDAKA